MSGWVKRPEPPHTCVMPDEVRYGDHNWIGSIWRCDCKKLWVFRTSWWFGDFPPWFQRTQPNWHRASWWKRIRYATNTGKHLGAR